MQIWPTAKDILELAYLKHKSVAVDYFCAHIFFSSTGGGN